MYKLIKLLLFKSNLRFRIMKFKFHSRFSDPRFEIRIRVFDQGRTKFVRISEEFELSEFGLPGVNYYKMYYQIQGEIGFSSS